MTTQDWDLLLEMVEPHITKKNTKMRLAISPRERLYLTLRFLATGPFTADDLGVLQRFISPLFYLSRRRNVPVSEDPLQDGNQHHLSDRLGDLLCSVPGPEPRLPQGRREDYCSTVLK